MKLTSALQDQNPAVLGAAVLSIAIRILNHPLRNIPGPWYCHFTNLVLTFNTILARRIYYVDELHHKYGAVVRISNDEVDISDVEGFKVIHKIGNGFLKNKWYKDFTASPVEDVFTTTNPKIHASRRRVLNPALSPAALRQNWEWLIQQKVSLAVSKLKTEAIAGTSDAYKWFTLMSSDVVGQISTGEIFGLVENGKKSGFFEDLAMLNQVNGMRAVFGPLWPLIHRYGPQRFQEMVKSEARVHEYCGKVVMNIRERKGDKANVFTQLLTEEPQENEESVSDAAAAFEVLGLILAGAGTTAITLAYLIWAVLRHPVVQSRLENEVAQLRDNFTELDLKQLPYLNAVIQESLRLYTAIPGGLQRVVPAAGLQVGGYKIPPGTTVVTQAYTIHRDSSLWDSPLQFRPERFLPENLTTNQKTSLSHYGAGTRICLGMHLANMVMLYSVAVLFRECRGLRLAETMKDEMMDFMNFFVVVPKGEKCEVTLSKR